MKQTRIHDIKVRLIDKTHNAGRKLVYTKNTRLTQGEDTYKKIMAMNTSELHAELAYMANTIKSSWEFVNYTFEIVDCTRAFTHQLVRTRHGSYAQQSQRTVDMSGFGYIIPEAVLQSDSDVPSQIYQDMMATIASNYKNMIDHGIKPEDARGILPTNVHTSIIASFNLRTLSDMAGKRTSVRTQSEYRVIFDKMLNEVLVVHPWAKQFLFPVTGTGSIDKLLRAAKEREHLEREEFDALVMAAAKEVDKMKEALRG